MRRARLANGELEFEFRGSGQPVLLIHGELVCDSLLPLLNQPSLADGFLPVYYRRRGYGGSTPLLYPESVAQQAADAAALLRTLGFRKAHVLGESFGAAIALQLALDFPELVGSVAVLQTPLLAEVPSAKVFRQRLAPLLKMHARGKIQDAGHGLLQEFFGPDYEGLLTRHLGPEAIERAIAHEDTYVLYELPALDLWRFPEMFAARITNPLLSLSGDDSSEPFREAHELLMRWFPAEELELPGPGRALPLQAPEQVAAAVARFFRRHAHNLAANYRARIRR